MICLYQIQTRCFRDYAFARIRKHCGRIGRLFCGTRMELERFLTIRRQEVEDERQYEVRQG